MAIKPVLIVFVGLASLVGSAGLAGCSGGEPEPAPAPADSLTQRQRDSIIGESRLPGARGVKGALQASDAADARARALDSLTRIP